MADIENRPAGKPRARSRAGTVTHAADEPVWGGNAAAAGEHARAMDLQAELQATQARFAELGGWRPPQKAQDGRGLRR